MMNAMKLVQLTREQRALLVTTYIETSDALTRRRAQCLLLLDDDRPFEFVVAATQAEAAEVMETINLFRDKGLDFITG